MKARSKTHAIVAGLLVCLNKDGGALDWNQPHKWAYCPYCGVSLRGIKEAKE